MVFLDMADLWVYEFGVEIRRLVHGKFLGRFQGIVEKDDDCRRESQQNQTKKFELGKKGAHQSLFLQR